MFSKAWSPQDKGIPKILSGDPWSQNHWNTTDMLFASFTSFIQVYSSFHRTHDVDDSIALIAYGRYTCVILCFLDLWYKHMEFLRLVQLFSVVLCWVVILNFTWCDLCNINIVQWIVISKLSFPWISSETQPKVYFCCVVLQWYFRIFPVLTFNMLTMG